MQQKRVPLTLLSACTIFLVTAPAQQTAESAMMPAAPSVALPAHATMPTLILGITKPSPEDTLPSCPVKDHASDAKSVNTPSVKLNPPRLLEYVEPSYSKIARKKHIEDIALIYLTVSAEGLPTNLCLGRSIGYGLDEQAALAVRQYKFAPATDTNGKAVPMRIALEVKFLLLRS